jgi:hypothetical protein
VPPAMTTFAPLSPRSMAQQRSGVRWTVLDARATLQGCAHGATTSRPNAT